MRGTRNGDDAARFYASTTYDLVLTDLWHLGLEGHKLIKTILKKNPGQAVGIISSSTMMEEELDVPRLGSFEANDLLAFVKRIADSTPKTPVRQGQ